jgi:cellobiose epimerase
MVDLSLGQHTDLYFKAFQRQWQGIKNYQIDNEFHGVYEMVGPDGNPVNANKGRIRKAAYHDGRALLNVSERLRHLTGAGTK